MQCGLLGRKLGHSYSPQIHALLGNYSYDLFETEPQDLESFLKNANFQGLNVTIPYKKAVIEFCDHLSPEALKLGAVNTIIKASDGSLSGHNTDYYGFQYMLRKSGLNVTGKKVLVLGSGGAAVTVSAVLNLVGAIPVIISRHGENNYQNLHLHEDAAAIVNATPVGMYPDTGISPVKISDFPSLEGVLDLIYNPARTQLLLDAEMRGLIAVNGLWMLVAQAKMSAELFTGQAIPEDIIDTIYSKLCTKMKNIVLIGMPGCGKSTIGKLLAKQLDKNFVDVDTYIEQIANKTIPTIFNEDGENLFRKLETQALNELGKQSGLVIATGGGCVTQERNYPLLHQNGYIVWIKRDLTQLPVDGRPLSQNISLQTMFQQRQSSYESFADYTVFNDTTPEEVADLIAALEDKT